MLPGLLAGLALASAPSPAAGSTPKTPPTLAELDQKRFELHLGGRAGGRFGGGASFGGGLSLGLGVRLWQGLYLTAGVGEGLFQANRRASEDTPFRHAAAFHQDAGAASPSSSSAGGRSGILAGQILLGLRYELRTPKTTKVRPTFFLGASHLHEATLDDFLLAPGETLAGVSKSIRHRTGLAAGVGLRVPFPATWGPVAPRFSLTVDGDFAYYFDAHPGRAQAGLGLGVQVVF